MIVLMFACPACQQLSPLPYAAIEAVTCEACHQAAPLTYDDIADAQHALLVALGESEPVQAVQQ